MSDTIIAAVVGGALAGAFVVLGQGLSRSVAREQRTWDRKADGYVQLLHVISTQVADIDAAPAGFGEGPDFPEPPSAAALRDVLPALDAFGSRAVRHRVREWERTVHLLGLTILPALRPDEFVGIDTDPDDVQAHQTHLHRLAGELRAQIRAELSYTLRRRISPLRRRQQHQLPISMWGEDELSQYPEPHRRAQRSEV